MSPSQDSTRPITVAELLARNGTIGAPPVSGRRRRRRGNDRAVSVAELTGEIPVIADPAVEETVAEVEVADPAVEETVAEVEVEEWTVEETVAEVEVAELAVEETVAEAEVEEWKFDGVSSSAETVVIYPVYAEPVSPVYVEDPVDVEDPADVEDPVDVDYADYPDYTGQSDYTGSAAMVESARPLSSEPLPSLERAPELSHDPRVLRRPSGAEQMTFDPVDDSVDLANLIDEQTDDVEELRSYLRSSQGALFSGETIADDLARRGLNDLDDIAGPTEAPAPRSRPREDRLTSLRHGLVAVLQSVLAVVLGAGLFIAFDQLWRWNNIVALVLSVLVILGLVVAVRLVRKTEDIGSTLIAVAVGALITLGPLALLQTN